MHEAIERGDLGCLERQHYDKAIYLSRLHKLVRFRMSHPSFKRVKDAVEHPADPKVGALPVTVIGPVRVAGDWQSLIMVVFTVLGPVMALVQILAA